MRHQDRHLLIWKPVPQIFLKITNRLNVNDPPTEKIPKLSLTLSPIPFLIFPSHPFFIFQMIQIYLLASSLRSNVLEAIVVQLPPVDLSIIVGVYLREELLEFPLDHLLIEEFMLLQLLSDPCLELPLLEDVTTVLVVAQEDVFDEAFAKCVHGWANKSFFLLIRGL